MDGELDLLECKTDDSCIKLSISEFLGYKHEKEEERKRQEQREVFRSDPKNYPMSDADYEVESILDDWDGPSDQGTTETFYLVKFEGFQIPPAIDMVNHYRAWIHIEALRRHESRILVEEYIKRKAIKKSLKVVRGWAVVDEDIHASGVKKEDKVASEPNNEPVLGKRRSNTRDSVFNFKLEQEPKLRTLVSKVAGLTPKEIICSYLNVPDSNGGCKANQDAKNSSKENIFANGRGHSDKHCDCERYDGLTYHLVLFETARHKYCQMVSDVDCKAKWPEITQAYYLKCAKKKSNGNNWDEKWRVEQKTEEESELEKRRKKKVEKRRRKKERGRMAKLENDGNHPELTD